MRRRTSQSVLLLALAGTLIGCEVVETGSTANIPAAAGSPQEGDIAFGFTQAAWRAPTEADIPDDSLGASIRRGLYLMRHTPDSLPDYARSGLTCVSCHQEDGRKLSAAPLLGSHAVYPKYMSRTGTAIAMADRVNYCFTRSLAGNALPPDSREMQNILAYMAHLSRGVPVGTAIESADEREPMERGLVGDTTRGRAIYAKECVACHMPDGQGNAAFPPLWGPRSYSIGASMARESRAASFIWRNMPQAQPGKLTQQEAFDVAAYINAQPRPDSPGKEHDWPTGGAPADAPYNTAGHDAYRPPATLVPRSTPERSVVPVPQRVARQTGTN